MIKTEISLVGGVSFTSVWSDEGMYLRDVETGTLYQDAYNLTAGAPEYIETQILISDAPTQ